MNNIDNWETVPNYMSCSGYQKGEKKFWNQQRTDQLEFALLTGLQSTLITVGIYCLLISLS